MIDLSPRQLATVKSILAEHVPECEVRAYGSRATWTARDYSDVDLAVVGKGPLDREVIADLKEAFQDSDLPMRVDVLDWHSVSEEFREAIKAEMVVLPVRGSDRSHVATVWQEARLGDLVRLISGGTPAKKRAAYWNGAIPWASARDMKQFRLRDTIHHVTAEGLANGTKQVPVGTLLLLTRGMRLLKELPVCVTQRPMAFNQDVKALLPKDRIDRGFLAYLVLGNKHRLLNLVDLAGHGTGRINSDELRALNVRLPPKPEQRAIAHVLGTLDDKIELNRRMNETLEAMARVLFKSWFVDFDPVRAKIEGRDTGLPDHLADLFPDRLVDSEMGEMPEGWEVSEIGKEVKAVGGTTPSTKNPSYWDQGHHCWATPKDLSKLDSPVLLETNRRITNAGLRKISSGALPVGTVLLSSRAPIGYLAITEVHTAVNQGFIAMICDQRLPNLYVLRWCDRNLGHIRNIAGGSTFAEISKKVFRPIPVLVPPAATLGLYERLSRPLHERLVANTKECVTLGALRDTLLPKLISGEIRVPDAERTLASVT